MSSIWKKIRDGGSSKGGSPSYSEGGATPIQSVESPSSGSQNFSTPTPSQTHHNIPNLVTPEDELVFISDAGEESEGRIDPLIVKSQIVKKLDDILTNQSVLPYFSQFLHGCGADKYLRFWLDVNSFRAAAVTRIHSRDLQASRGDSPVLLNDTLNFDVDRKVDSENVNNQRIIKDRLSEPNLTESWLQETRKSCSKQTHSSREKGLILPDLVSNIKDNIVVTPLNSPDGNSSTGLANEIWTSDDRKGTASVKEDVSKTLVMKNCQENNHLLEEKTVVTNANDAVESSVNSRIFACSRAQKLKESIASDAMMIYNKYIAKDAEHSLGLDDATRDVIRHKISEWQDLDPECFSTAQSIIHDLLDRDYLTKFIGSDYHLKHQIDVLTSGSVLLVDILYSDSAFPYFMEYVDQEGGQNFLQFWVATSNFRQQLVDTTSFDPVQAQTDAMVLYDKYFSLQAKCPLGFSDKVRFNVEGNICREGGPLPSCFDVPMRVVMHVMEKDILPGYLSSGLHIKYLSELVNAVKMSLELFGRKKRSGSESTCSSEQSSSFGSVSAYNTLLAMDTSASNRFRNLNDPSIAMRIDESQISDPDSLWRRKHFSKMSCGFINELGRFESDLQPEPDRKMESRLSRTLKRFVNMDEDKVKEDMAYQVAEMIIKDVTRVTLGSKHSRCSSVDSSVPPLSPSSVSQDALSDVFPS